MVKVNGIIQVGDPILRKKAKKVKKISAKEKDIISKMKEILKKNDGIGIAAPQIGESLRIIIAKYFDDKKSDKKPGAIHVLINPEITYYSGETEEMEEGCLSFKKPEIRGVVSRPKKIRVRALNVKGELITLSAESLFARTLLHEIDHLEGILFTDRAIPETIYEVIKKNDKKIYFLSSSSFGAIVLRNLSPKILKNLFLITLKDKPQGRGLKKLPNLAKKEAQEIGIPILEIKNKKELANILKKKDYDLAIVGGFSLILPEEALVAKKTNLKNICLHPSLLPKFKGPSPIQTAILQEEKETGVSIFEIEKELDSGKILWQEKIKINNNDKYKELEEKLARLSANILNEKLNDYLDKKIKSRPQKGKASYTKLFKKTDGKILPTDTPKQIFQKFKAFYPWPGIYFETKGKRVKITELDYEKGKLIIKKVLPEGKREMSFGEFLNGYSLPLDLKEKIL